MLMLPKLFMSQKTLLLHFLNRIFFNAFQVSYFEIYLDKIRDLLDSK